MSWLRRAGDWKSSGHAFTTSPVVGGDSTLTAGREKVTKIDNIVTANVLHPKEIVINSG